jgi:hypothetical protein
VHDVPANLRLAVDPGNPLMLKDGSVLVALYVRSRAPTVSGTAVSGCWPARPSARPRLVLPRSIHPSTFEATTATINQMRALWCAARRVTRPPPTHTARNTKAGRPAAPSSSSPAETPWQRRRSGSSSRDSTRCLQCSSTSQSMALRSQPSFNYRAMVRHAAAAASPFVFEGHVVGR